MNALLALTLPLQNISTTQSTCKCEIHNYELLQQLDANLPNGTPVRVLLDHLGYHVAIGDINTCPPGVSASKAKQILQEAISHGNTR